MLLLESFTHRERLARIIARWMVNQPADGDVHALKQIVNFNIYMIRLWLPRVVRTVLGELHDQAPTARMIRHKGDLKDFLVDNLTYSTNRVEELCGRYRRWPEDYFRETPVHGAYYTIPGERGPIFVGSSRIKRFRRIAEKGSRRIVDFLLERIRKNADEFAEQRARTLGIPRTELVTPREVEIDEFLHAERRVLKGIKRGTIYQELPQLHIPDVAGAKFILEGDLDARLVEILERVLPCEVVEVEKHRGDYNASNLKVRYRLPRDLLLASPPTQRYLDVLVWRGFDRERVATEYRKHVEQGEDEVYLEIIVSNFAELVESEIGRCMHEQRIVSLRRDAEYNGFLATNVRYLMDYLFGLCRSPNNHELRQLPIKLWVQYIPEAIEQILLEPYIPLDGYFDSVLELPELGEGYTWP
jgi:hypothetical protein